MYIFLADRRDGIPATAKILEKSLRLLFEKRDLSQVRAYVQHQFAKIIAASISIQEMTFAKVSICFSKNKYLLQMHCFVVDYCPWGTGSREEKAKSFIFPNWGRWEFETQDGADMWRDRDVNGLVFHCKNAPV